MPAPLSLERLEVELQVLLDLRTRRSDGDHRGTASQRDCRAGPRRRVGYGSDGKIVV